MLLGRLGITVMVDCTEKDKETETDRETATERGGERDGGGRGGERVGGDTKIKEVWGCVNLMISI